MRRVAAALVALTLLALGWQLATREAPDVPTRVAPIERGEGVARDAAAPPTDVPTGAAMPGGGRVTRDAPPAGGVLSVPLLRLDAPDEVGEFLSGAARSGEIVVAGRVTDEEGAPVAGVVVRAVQRGRSAGERSIGQARTDAEGWYSMTARVRVDTGTSRAWRRARGGSRSARRLGERAAEELDDDVRRVLLAQLRLQGDARSKEEEGSIVVSVADARGLEAEHRFEPAPDERERRVDLCIRREFPFGGSVVDGSEPAPFASVLLFDAERNLLRTTTADEAGEFELAAPPAGRYELLARAPGHGAAGIGGVSLGPGQRSLKQNLALGGVGVLRGRVLYPDGEPVAGLQLHGVLDALAARNPERPHLPTPLQLLEEERGGGLALSTAVTEEDGRFRMEGMQPGSYRLLLDLENTGLDPEGLFPTGTEHGILFHASRIAVSVLEDGGWRAGGVRLARGAVRVHCVRADWRDLPPGTPSRHLVAATRFGTAQFLVQAEHDWVVFAEDEGQLTPEVAVRFRGRPGDGLARIDLTPETWIAGESVLAALAPPEERARLEIVVRAPDGERLDAELWLRREEDGALTTVYEGHRIGEGKSLGALRAGTYQYRLLLSAGSSRYWVSPRPVPLDLPPGADLTLEVEASPVLYVLATVVAEEETGHGGALEFEAELLPARPADDARGSGASWPDRSALDAFGLVGELRFGLEFGRGFGRGPLVVGERKLAVVRQPAGAYRLRLTAVDDPSERYEATFQLRADRYNELRFVLPER